MAFRSHWRFEAEFCTPAEPHEKGGIEGEAGYFRRNHWVPAPEAAGIADMNRQLLNACQQDEHRLIAGREQTVGAGMVIEREHLLSLAAEGADLAQTSFLTVNGLGCVKVLTNTYSVPLPVATTGPRSGALPGCAVSQARRLGRIEAAGAEAPGRSVAARASTGSGKRLWSATANRAGPDR